MGIEPGTSRTKSGCVTTAPPSQLRVTIVIKLFNCFEALVQNIKNKAELVGHTFSTNLFFSEIFLHAWTAIFGSFSCLQE